MEFSTKFVTLIAPGPPQSTALSPGHLVWQCLLVNGSELISVSKQKQFSPSTPENLVEVAKLMQTLTQNARVIDFEVASSESVNSTDDFE